MQTNCFLDAPPDWTWGPVSMLARVNPRYPARKGCEYSFIEMAAVGEHFTGVATVATRTLEGSGLSRFKVGDTLFAKITPCPENGKVAFVEQLPTALGLGSTEFIVLSPRPDCDPRYLYHLVCSHEVRGHAVARMEGSTGRQRVPDDAFKKRLLVPVPSHDEQVSIRRELDAVDAILERTRTAVGRARELRRSLMQDLLPPWIGLRALTDLQKPEGVEEVVRADVVTDVCNGSTPSRSEGRYWRHGTIPWLPTGKVHDRIIKAADEFVTEAALRECSIRLLPADTVLVGMIGQGRTRGMAAYLDMGACINQNFGAFTPKQEARPRVFGKWLFYYFDFHYSRLREVGGGTNQGALNCHLLKGLRLPLPGFDRQKEVAGILDSLGSLETAHLTVLAALDSLKYALSIELLTGRVRVKVAAEATAV